MNFWLNKMDRSVHCCSIIDYEFAIRHFRNDNKMGDVNFREDFCDCNWGQRKKWPIADWRIPEVFARSKSAQFLFACATDLTIRATQGLLSVKYRFEEANVALNFL